MLTWGTPACGLLCGVCGVIAAILLLLVLLINAAAGLARKTLKR